jgi:TATA-box binding protein (TBP) (component of TFIID and TFIIIB)
MCSVARLVKPHAQAQREHVRESYRAYDALMDFSVPVDLPPDEYKRQCVARADTRPFRVAPSEGWLIRRCGLFAEDPMLTSNTLHDVVPREVLRAEDPTTRDRSGTDRIAREVGAGVRQRLEEYDLLKRARQSEERPLHEHFVVRQNMPVHVVNIVHTSYCTVHGADPATKTLFPSVWMWRRLAFLGCQENHTHTSLKISFKPPFKASKLFFSTGRVLETGSSNEDVSHVMFFDATLPYIRLAGLPGIDVRRRASQNVVAKSRMPDGQRLLLDLLETRMGVHVSYNKSSFAGTVIRHPDMEKVMLLAFSAGSIVCVGPKDVPSMRVAFDSLYDTLHMHTDTEENRAILARYQGDTGVPTSRGRKRRRDEDEGEEEVNPVHMVTT